MSDVWRTENLYSRGWRVSDADFYRSLVAGWEGMPVPPESDARAAVAAFASGIPATPYSAETPKHWRAEVYCLHDDTPVGGLWGTVEGTIWTHVGQAVLPVHRGRGLSAEGGRAGMHLFFAQGGTEVLTAAIVPRLSDRVAALWSPSSPEYQADAEGVLGTVRMLRITESQFLDRVR